jgi:hypothetical protein
MEKKSFSLAFKLMTVSSLGKMTASNWKRNSFNWKVENILKDYLSYHIIDDKELNQIMTLQSHSINNLRNKVSDEVLQKRNYRTPGRIRFKVIRPDQDLELIDPESQKRYHSEIEIQDLIFVML